jgi:predicted amino acid-binding ACT domain protein
LFNLKNNEELREAVLQGRISASRLCQMTPEEMASEELKHEREKIIQQHTQMIEVDDSELEEVRYKDGIWVKSEETHEMEP